MSLKHRVSKIISIVLIFGGLYQLAYSAFLIFFVYPKFQVTNDAFGLLVQQGLVEKAIVYWLLIVIQGFYGLSLLFKSEEEVKIFHLVTGALISLSTVFFVIKTPLTIDPLLSPVVEPVFHPFIEFLRKLL